MLRRCWLLFALWLGALGACSPTDVVARVVLRDSGISKPPDAGPMYEAGAEAGAEAGCPDGPDCGMPPAPGTCPAHGCPSLASRSEFCAPSQPTAALVGDGCGDDGRLQFRFAFCSCGGLTTNSKLEVDALGGTGIPASVAINGDLQLGPETTIAGSLYVTGRYEAAAAPRVTGSIMQKASPQCNCADDQLLNVPQLVGARALDNDNAAAMLNAGMLNGYDAPQNLSLDCGRYYFDEVNGSEPLFIEARGRVGLFIAGNLSVNDNFTLSLTPGSSAEIFVLGNMHVGGRLELGSGTDGNRVTLVVNGTGTVNLRDGLVEGSVYAPHTQIVTRGPLDVRGSVFVNRANFGSEVHLRYLPLTAARTMCGG
jgi:hypothetical protein